MKLAKWNEKVSGILSDLCECDTDVQRSVYYCNLESGVVFCDRRGTWLLYYPNEHVCTSHGTSKNSDVLRDYWNKAQESDAKLVDSAVSGKFTGQKGKIVKLSRDGMDVYVSNKYYSMFPKNTLFYTESPVKPVLAGIWENDRLHLLGLILPIRITDKTFEAA